MWMFLAIDFLALEFQLDAFPGFFIDYCLVRKKHAVDTNDRFMEAVSKICSKIHFSDWARLFEYV